MVLKVCITCIINAGFSYNIFKRYLMNFLLSCIIGNRRASAYSSIAQSVEHAAVNRAVVGSSPTRGAFYYCPVLPGLNRLTEAVRYDSINKQSGPMVKRLRHRPFTAVTRVRISLGSFDQFMIRRCGSIGRAADL